MSKIDILRDYKQEVEKKLPKPQTRRKIPTHRKTPETRRKTLTVMNPSLPMSLPQRQPGVERGGGGGRGHTLKRPLQTHIRIHLWNLYIDPIQLVKMRLEVYKGDKKVVSRKKIQTCCSCRPNDSK